MAIYTTIIGSAVSFLVLAIDVTAFFVLISAVVLVRRVPWLIPFHQAGGALVKSYMGLVDRGWTRFGLRSLSVRGKHIIGLLVLEAMRLILVGITSLL